MPRQDSGDECLFGRLGDTYTFSVILGASAAFKFRLSCSKDIRSRGESWLLDQLELTGCGDGSVEKGYDAPPAPSTSNGAHRMSDFSGASLHSPPENVSKI